jgi:hypothetical protein
MWGSGIAESRSAGPQREKEVWALLSNDALISAATISR